MDHTITAQFATDFPECFFVPRLLPAIDLMPTQALSLPVIHIHHRVYTHRISPTKYTTQVDLEHKRQRTNRFSQSAVYQSTVIITTTLAPRHEEDE